MGMAHNKKPENQIRGSSSSRSQFGPSTKQDQQLPTEVKNSKKEFREWLKKNQTQQEEPTKSATTSRRFRGLFQGRSFGELDSDSD